MKNLIITIAALTISLTSALATTTPETLISNESTVVVSLDNADFITSTHFDAETENLSFTTAEEISVIQIFNAEGELEFQLPVMSDNVKINKNLFGSGAYKLGFILKGENHLHTTQVTIK